MTCTRCDELLDELGRLQAELTAARKEAQARTWERDHALAAHRRVQDELLALQVRFYAKPADRG